MEKDYETDKILTEGEELMHMCKGRGWDLAKRRLFEKISELSNILALTDRNPEALMLEIVGNQQAIKILLEWVQDIEGEVARTKDYRENFDDLQKNEYLKYL